MPVAVVHVLEVIDVEHQAAELAIVAAGAHDVAFESFLQVALVVDLRQAIDDGHTVDLFVVLGFCIGAGQELQDGRAHLDAVAVLQRLFAGYLLFVDVGTVGAALVDDVPACRAPLEMGVSAADAVAFQDDVVVRSTPDAHGCGLQDEALTEQCPFGRVDDDEAVRARTFARLGGGHHLGDARFFVLLAQSTPNLGYPRRPAPGLCQTPPNIKTVADGAYPVKSTPGKRPFDVLYLKKAEARLGPVSRAAPALGGRGCSPKDSRSGILGVAGSRDLVWTELLGQRHGEAGALHQAERIARRDRTWSQCVVECHLGLDFVCQVFPEVELTDSVHQVWGQLTEFHVMGRDDSESSPAQELRQDPASTDLTLARVRSVQHLVQEEEDGKLAVRGVQGRLQLVDLCVEVADAAGQRVCDTNAGRHLAPTQLEVLGNHGPSSEGEHDVQPNGAQEGAFARHVRAGDQERLPRFQGRQRVL